MLRSFGRDTELNVAHCISLINYTFLIKIGYCSKCYFFSVNIVLVSVIIFSVNIVLEIVIF